MKKDTVYLCIDLKSFYASVECVERGLDPMTTKLVVADPERTEKTICLAISPAMKKLGIKNRCRVFEIPKNVDYIMAEPRMQKYIDVSADIYAIYLKYIVHFLYMIEKQALTFDLFQNNSFLHSHTIIQFEKMQLNTSRIIAWMIIITGIVFLFDLIISRIFKKHKL